MVKFPVNLIPAQKNQRLHHKSHHSGKHILYIYIYLHTYPSQWEFQDPKMEVPTIHKAYFLGLCK